MWPPSRYIIRYISNPVRKVLAMEKETVYEYGKSLFWAMLISLLLITFVVQAFYIPSGSMRPTLQVGDRILVNKFIYRFTEPERKDIIVFKYPVEPNRKFIKRVIGVGGDKVQIIRGQVYLNNKPIEEDYILNQGYSNYGPVEVPENNYFVLGDNRNNSEDSRFWGFVPEDNIVGQAFMIFWPLNRIRLLING